MPNMATSRDNKPMFSAENRAFISPICAVCAAPAKAETRKDTEGKPALQHQWEDSLRSSQEAGCIRSKYSGPQNDEAAFDNIQNRTWPHPRVPETAETQKNPTLNTTWLRISRIPKAHNALADSISFMGARCVHRLRCRGVVESLEKSF